MANATVIVDPNGGLWQTRPLLWILSTVLEFQNISDTVHAPFIKYKCNYLVQPSDRQQYTSTVSTKYGVCVLGAAHLVALTVTAQHPAIYFLFTKPVDRPYSPLHIP
jgi:hypothetical protein